MPSLPGARRWDDGRGAELMAGDWIKMRTDLRTHPKVVRISSALNADTLRTVGGLWSAWCLFDTHSEDGRLVGYTPEVVDSLIGWPGFAGAMMTVGWLESKEVDGVPCLEAPRFDAHNGQSAKRRAQEADRKRIARKASASNADKMRTREEKRREESTDTPLPPGGDGDGAGSGSRELELSATNGLRPGSQTPATGAEGKLEYSKLNGSAKKKKGGAGKEEEALTWSAAEGWRGVTLDLVGELGEAYPACDIRRQFLAMEQWLKANRERARKQNWRRFVNNWLRREQERGGDLRYTAGAKKEGGAAGSEDAFLSTIGGGR